MGDLISGIGSFAGGMVGEGKDEEAQRKYQTMIQQYAGLNPNVAMPQQAQGDPQNQAIQNQMLQQALQRARAGGLNAIDVGRLNDIRNSQAQQTRAEQAAALSDAQQRGATQGNTGILGALMAGQNAANTGANQAMQAGAIGQESQNQANAQAAGQAGAQRQQNIGVEQGNINRNMYQANQNKQNEFERLGGEAALVPGEAGQLNQQARDWSNIGAGAGKTLGSLVPGGGGGGGGGMDWSKMFNVGF